MVLLGLCECAVPVFSQPSAHHVVWNRGYCKRLISTVLGMKSCKDHNMQAGKSPFTILENKPSKDVGFDKTIDLCVKACACKPQGNQTDFYLAGSDGSASGPPLRRFAADPGACASDLPGPGFLSASVATCHSLELGSGHTCLTCNLSNRAPTSSTTCRSTPWQ